MNIVVIGLGSMGKRRIRLIHEIFPDCQIYGIDGRYDRREEAKSLFHINCFASLSHIDDTVNCAFVCTSPLSHAAIITECLTRKWHVFTELNLVDDDYEKNINLARANNCKLFLSSTFLYREEIKYIRSKVTSGKTWNYIYHIGQYLPDWHPWENYRDYFVGNVRTNGCREIMAIELPWLLDTFGNVVEAHKISDKMTKLDIDYHDNFMIQLTHQNSHKGTLIVDVVSPYAIRKLEVYSEGSYLSWNGTPESLLEFNNVTGELENVCLNENTEHMEGYRAFVVENAYKNEIKSFFDVVTENKMPIYGFEQDRNTLKLIDSLGA